MKLTEATGKRIEELLKKNGYSQYQLQKKGGIPRSTVSVIISDKVKTVKLDTIYQIAATLGVSLKEFFDSPLFDDLDD